MREREVPSIQKDLLFKFKDNKDEKILFQKRWLRGCNTMFWSSPDEFKMPIKNIVTIALKNSSLFLSFLDLYLLLETDLMIYVNDIFDKDKTKIGKKYFEFYEMCYEIFRLNSQNYKDVFLEKELEIEQDFGRIIHSKLYKISFAEASEAFPIQLLYSKAVEDRNEQIQREIREYISNCFIADLQYIDKSR